MAALASSACINRLLEERRRWRKNHPFGFYAKPLKSIDGSIDLTRWEIGIPGKAGTIWEGGIYPVKLKFPKDYPNSPPWCGFPSGFYHPNVFPSSGNICLSLVRWDYSAALSLSDIAIGIQTLLNDPNPHTFNEAHLDYIRDMKVYEQKVKNQVRKYYSKI